MSDLFNSARQRLRDIYGFDFPEDFFHFWKFMQETYPTDPYTLPINVWLVGAFEILGSLLDSVDISQLGIPLRMHWRFYKDPPEFFTILRGEVAGFHLGYYYDDPAKLPSCICGYYHHDAYELWNAGSTLFDVVQTLATNQINSVQEWIEEGEYTGEDGQEEIAEIEEFLQQIQAYRDRHIIAAPPLRVQTAETWDRMGIVVPSDTYRPLTQTRKSDKLVEAQTALAEGFPGTALKFAKDLWALQDPEWEAHAIALHQAAYSALHRPLLNDILQEHLNCRDPGLYYIDLRFLATIS